MAIPRPKKEDYKKCDFCKLRNGCFYRRTNATEAQRGICNGYIRDMREIEKHKLRPRRLIIEN